MPIKEKNLLRSLINKAIDQLVKNKKLTNDLNTEEIDELVYKQVEIYKIERVQLALDKIGDPKVNPKMLETFLNDYAKIEIDYIYNIITNY